MIDFDPGAPPGIEFDKGPPIAIARHLAALPPIAPEHRELFWYDWGPVFYRGRLNGSAKLIAIASDPGPTERLVGRNLVGDAGQRVQGFITKLGLRTSYVLVNAFPHAVHPRKVSKALPLLSDPDQLAWRNRLFDLITDSRLEAIVAFGGNAQAPCGCGTPPPTCRPSRSRIPRHATAPIWPPSGPPRSPPPAPWSPQTPAQTRPDRTTEPASPRPTTPASHPPTCPTGHRCGSVTTTGDAQTPPTTTPSDAPPRTPTTP